MSDRSAPVGLAVIGAGYWGPNLIRNALRCADVDLKIVCDLNIETAQKAVGRQSNVAVSTDVQQILDNPDVEGVAIATPASTHAELAISCLEAGKHVLIEKPLASSVAEAEKVLAVAAARAPGHVRSHVLLHPGGAPSARARQLGEIGNVQYVDSVRINLGIVQPDIDVFWDLAPHDLSILDFILPQGCEPIAVARRVPTRWAWASRALVTSRCRLPAARSRTHTSTG